jgi:hypothetical protein
MDLVFQAVSHQRAWTRVDPSRHANIAPFCTLRRGHMVPHMPIVLAVGGFSFVNHPTVRTVIWLCAGAVVALMHTCKRELSPAHLVCPRRHNV